ncbi:class I SAM-dependent DNA methyltransferase [Paenibacillus sp. GCM10012307]|uniref:Class I SAM-dependent methyltransferase n=1 Tax=Paenibacillus roseus TaxID=2798579 RepID=A0A934MS96_9BACL|nr:class I SAM-dependent methyltransferase [Paenibacillus roseus]MBJ6363069.1 class I SAM-dependent methyltransferase [Paenibacillus roseus]
MRAYRQFASVYDRLMEDMPYPEWLSFARQCWERYGMPKSVADIGCGTGSIAIPLARSGFDVYGIDLSANMLSVARSKWEAGHQPAIRSQSGSVTFLQQDMRDWELPEQVDSVISFCDCLNYLTESEDVEAMFAATFRSLKDGGVFLFDVHPPSQLKRYAVEQPFVLDERDIAYIWTSELDEQRCEIEHHLSIFAREGAERDSLFQRIDEVHIQRAYEPAWLTGALLRAGFAKVEQFGDFRLEAPDAMTERLFFAALKEPRT